MYLKFESLSIDITQYTLYITFEQRRVEQLAARRAHNPEVIGSSPIPAIV